MRAQDELKPCPMCDSDAELVETRGHDFYVRCTKKFCGVRTKQFHENRNGAISIWNTRFERTCHAVASKTKTGRSHTCSICGGMIRTTSTNDNYCPNCGARVIGE